MIPVLDPDKAAEVVLKIEGLRHLWNNRLSGFPFWTFGAASYLDATKDLGWYQTQTRKWNPVLAENFEELNELVLENLRELTGEPVQQSEDFALPGFHVYQSCDRAKDGGKVHFDLQHHFLPWPDSVDRDKVFSFTLPVSLPESGGGLWLWPELPEELDSHIASSQRINNYGHGIAGACEEWAMQTPPEQVEYEVGTLYAHFGKRLHKIAPFRSSTDQQKRISYQGHGVWCEDRGWLVYW